MVNKEKLILVGQYTAIGLLIIGIGVITYFIINKNKCKPKCSKNQCGSDGCGGTCKTCEKDSICNSSNTCEKSKYFCDQKSNTCTQDQKKGTHSTMQNCIDQCKSKPSSTKYKCNQSMTCKKKSEMNFPFDSTFSINQGILTFMRNQGGTDNDLPIISLNNNQIFRLTNASNEVVDFKILSKASTNVYTVSPENINIQDTTREFLFCTITSTQCDIDPNGIFSSIRECGDACIKPELQPQQDRYKCSDNYSCDVDPNGIFSTIGKCDDACIKPPKQNRYKCNQVKTCKKKSDMKFPVDSTFYIFQGSLVFKRDEGGINNEVPQTSFNNTQEFIIMDNENNDLIFKILNKTSNNTYKVFPDNINILDTTQDFWVCTVISRRCDINEYGEYSSEEDCNTNCGGPGPQKPSSVCASNCDSSHSTQVKKERCTVWCNQYPCWDSSNGQCAAIDNKEGCLDADMLWCGN